MADTIWDYGIKFPYGFSTAYGPTFHTGEDWTVTDGRKDVPVTVNGVVIGIAGTTGLSTGIHTHVGKWYGGTHYPPNGKGASLPGAVVTQVDTVGKTNNGKFVRVKSGVYDFVFLHLDSVRVKVGDKLEGEDMEGLTKEDVIAIYGLAFDNEDYLVNPKVVSAFTGKGYRELVNYLRSDPSWIAHMQRVNNPVSSNPKAENLLKAVQEAAKG